MDVDDESGDLYSDIGPAIEKNTGTEPSVGEDELDVEELLYGTSSSLVALPSKPPSISVGVPLRTGIQSVLAGKEVDHDELFLYGQLHAASTEKPFRTDGPLVSVENNTGSISRPGKRLDTRETASSIDILDDSNFDLLVRDRTSAGHVLGPSGNIPLGAIGLAAVSGERALQEDSSTFHGRMLEGFGNRGLASDNDSPCLRRELVVSGASGQISSSPGLSSSVRVQLGFATAKKGEEQELREEWDGCLNEGVAQQSEIDVEDWDDDSEDDICIVLNEETSTYPGEKIAEGDEDERSEDEDGEALVIVNGHVGTLSNDEQEWEEQPISLDPPPRTSDLTSSSGLDRTPRGEDKGRTGSVGQGSTSCVPRIDYSCQGYHTHHMQYKYVRPGAGASSGKVPPSSQGSPQAGVASGRGTVGGSLAGWGPGRGGTGRDDWAGGGGRGSTGLQSSQGPGVISSWGAPRGFPSGVEFNLPPTNTVFDVDLDSLEEKPWRRPGVDITDYLNFSFTESTWKQYCRQLAQLRLEATMQRKIRVYGSGRSEQGYDPDLPPELAAATSMQDSCDLNLLQQRQQEDGLGPGSGRGHGLARSRMMPPAGRTIQVEGGDDERRPSADVRRQCSRDSHAIVLQDASEDDRPVSVPVTDGQEESQEENEVRVGAMSVKERRFYRSWEIEAPQNMWERESMPMGLGSMPNNMGLHGAVLMPGHRRDADGPGSFPVGPGMPMRQPGPNPNFGMFPGAPFPPPSAGRAGVVRLPLYDTPRPALPLQVPEPPPEGFPPVMVPLEYLEPSHRRAPPPRLSSPRKTLPQGVHLDWDDELSNGSGANWNSKQAGNHRERKDLDDGNGDWAADDFERWEGNHPGRGRELDQLSHGEKSLDRTSGEGRSEEPNRSVSRELHRENSDWDGGHSDRIAKKEKVQSLVDIRSKVGKEEFNSSKAVKSNVRKDKSTHSWETVKERLLQDDDAQQHRRRDVFHNKATDSKGHTQRDNSVNNRRKEASWGDRQDVEWNDRRQSREREGIQRRKVKEEDTHPYRSRVDLERDRRRDEQERDKRNPKKGKDDDRVKDEDKASQDERRKRYIDDHVWTSREREEGRPREDGKSASVDTEIDHSKERLRPGEDRGKLKRRLDHYREVDGRVKGRLEDIRETEGTGKLQLEERRENDVRVRGRFEDVRDKDLKIKRGLEVVRGSDKRKIKKGLEVVRGSDKRNSRI